MTKRQARFEVVRTYYGYHARFRASNGAIVWTTESFTRRATALRAVRQLDDWYGALDVSLVVDVDERLTKREEALIG